MKLLFENWNKFLKQELLENSKVTKISDSSQEDENLKYNLNFFIKNSKRLPHKFNYILSSLNPSDLSDITSLKETQILKFVAAGTLGTVYKLKNGNMLKIYTGTHKEGGSGINTENNRYQQIIKRTHSGMSYKGELPVYDSGIAYIHGNTYGWVEMGRVLVLGDYNLIVSDFNEKLTQKINNSVTIFFVYRLRYLIRAEEESNPIQSLQDFHSRKSLIDFIQDSKEWKSMSASLNEEGVGIKFANKLLDAAIQIWLDNNKNFDVFGDMHEGNIGVIGLTDPTPVFFDI